MSLRTRLLVFFGLLAVLPLLTMGLFQYVHAMRTLERHLQAQVQEIGERVGAEVGRRHAVVASDLALLGENAESQRLLATAGVAGAAGAAGGAQPAEREAALAAARSFFDAAWEQMGGWYHAVELRDGAGAVLLRKGGAEAAWEGTLGGTRPAGDAPVEFRHPVVEAGTGRLRGQVVAYPRLREVLPADALEARFGESGYTVLVDRASGRVLHRPPAAGGVSAGATGVGALAEELGLRLEPELLGLGGGTLRFRHRDTMRVAVVQALAEPQWTVVVTSSLDEFAAPFQRMRTLNLLLVLLLVGAVVPASLLLVRGATRSLEELSAAAGEVGRGEFLPALPPAGRDEVGRLSASFAAMTRRLQEMMGEIERSRQLAAIGEFAAEIAHEIRNPLTSVKLNLQRIERAVESGAPVAEAGPPLVIALREVRRLERVVRGVLHLGRPTRMARRPVALHLLVAEALEVIRPQAARQAVLVSTSFAAPRDVVAADAQQLTGALLNLLLNGLDALPQGGDLAVATRQDPTRAGWLELTVADTGPGVPVALRDRLFRPFTTTKPEGTGLGLATALRTVEAHGGTLELVDAGGADAPGGDGEGGPGRGGGAGVAVAGALFRIRLPLAPGEGAA
jgi:signal transduction histidine kinase